MLLADQIIAKRETIANQQSSPGKMKSVVAIASMINYGARFCADKNSADLINDVASDTVFKGTNAPSGVTWFEMPWTNTLRSPYLFMPMEHGINELPNAKDLKQRWGMLYRGQSDPSLYGEDGCAIEDLMVKGFLTRGSINLFVEYSSGRVLVMHIDVENETGTWKAKGTTLDNLQRFDNPLSPEYMPNNQYKKCVATIAKVFWAFCMLMSNPKLTERTEVANPKLNKEREKNGKSALVDYTRVKLSVDGPIHRAGHNDSSISDPEQKGKKRRHFVRHFWRTRLNRLEFVSPRQCGNADMGTKPAFHKVHT